MSAVFHADALDTSPLTAEVVRAPFPLEVLAGLSDRKTSVERAAVSPLLSTGEEEEAILGHQGETVAVRL